MAGNCTIETCGEIFAPTARQASSNYGVGTDGRVGLYVNESDRSWCSSNSENDNRAVTIEVANDENKEPWHVSDKALAALIELCADICKRNNIKKLLWQNDKKLVGQVDKQNMTVHRWFAAKSCPGDYLYNKHGYISDEVNKRLGTSSATTPTVTSPTVTTSYLVKVTASVLNVRAQPTTDSKVTTTVKNGEVYTIIGEPTGTGAKNWGKLKSGAGWISLDFTQRV
jgi:hypothetical protein